VPVLILVIFVLNLVPAVAPRPPPLRKASVAELREGAISGREQRLRAAALDRFAAWLNVAAGETVEVLARASPLRLSEHLEEYLYQLFEMRWSRGEGRQVLLATADMHSWMRNQLAGPWRVLRNWERLEPDKHRAPLPVVWLKALAVTAMTWSWPRVALILLLSFFGLLRPSESYGLSRSDFLLPSDHDMGEYLLLRIREPKSRWASGHQQYVRIGREAPLDWLVSELSRMRMNCQIWPGSPGTFCSRLRMLSKECLGREDLVLPSGLRTGGATFVFQKSDEDLGRLLWRGRWRDIRMLGIYIQELSAAMVRMKLQHDDDVRVRRLADLYADVFGLAARG
jgi:hypothetical protein